MSGLKKDIFALLIGAVFLLLHSKPIQASSDSQRVSQLSNLKSSSSSKLIRLDIRKFEEFIESAPRSYNMFVMFTADPSMCQPCGPMRKQLGLLAQEYEQLPEKKKSSKPTFFAELKISAQDQVLLQKYGIQHVPIFYLFRASASRTYPTILREGSLDNYPLQKLGLSINQMKEFVNARTGAKLKVVTGGYQIPFVQTVRTFMPALLMMAALAVLIGIVSEAYKSPMVWFGLVVLVYIFSVGGGHYSWIHNTPLAVVNKDGMWEYIASGSRSQYVAEGFFVSATCVSISVLVILIQEMPSVIPNKSSQTFVGMIMLAMTTVAIFALLVMYHYKMPQYLQYSEM